MSVIPKEVIEEVDKKYFDPHERAQGVHNIVALELQKAQVTKWDILCWAIEYTGRMSIAVENEQLIGLSKAMTQWLYSTHYSSPQSIYGAPDREEN